MFTVQRHYEDQSLMPWQADTNDLISYLYSCKDCIREPFKVHVLDNTTNQELWFEFK